MNFLALAGSMVVNCGLVVAMSSFYNPPDIIRVGGFGSGSTVQYHKYIVDGYLTEPCMLTIREMQKIGYNSIRYVQPADIENYVHCSFRQTNGANADAWILDTRLTQIYGEPQHKMPGFQDRLVWTQFTM